VSTEVINSAVAVLVKLLVLSGLGIYIVYAAVIVRQEQLMTKTVKAASYKILRVFALLHLAAALLIFVLAIILL
jgi:uncharacterized membrane protein YdjX (TVP38/TMEM64 family)